MGFGLMVLAAALDPAPSGDIAAITVLGERQNEDEIRAEASDYLRKTEISVGDTQVARWQAKVCAKVFGLPDPKASARVLSRFRTIAEAAGAPLAHSTCQTNVAIIFTDNAAALIKRMASNDPRRFSDMSIQRKKELLQGGQPMRWWYETRVANRDGSPVSAVLPPWTSGNSESGGPVIPSNQDSTVLQTTGSSIVGSSSVRQIVRASVIVDVELATGKSLDAVSDLAAFVSLAEVRGNTAPKDSILGLFAEDAIADRLSAWDAVFLKALYAMPLDRNARSQRGKIVSAMVNQAKSP
jgi:hypothetical protein